MSAAVVLEPVVPLDRVAAELGISHSMLERGCRQQPPRFRHTVTGGGEQRKRRGMTAEQIAELKQALEAAAVAQPEVETDPLAQARRQTAERLRRRPTRRR